MSRKKKQNILIVRGRGKENVGGIFVDGFDVAKLVNDAGKRLIKVLSFIKIEK